MDRQDEQDGKKRRAIPRKIPESQIETNRIRLPLIGVATLQALFEGNIRAAQKTADFLIDEDCPLLGEYWVGQRLKLIEADPSQHEWMYRAVVRKTDGQMVGHISFHHKAPDPTFAQYSTCGAELGYTIQTAYRRQGYAAESAAAMMAWARTKGVLDFFLTINPENTASIALAAALGYVKIGEMADDVDGMEYLYRSR
jgi:RimJ/RimL family protein N-acetyltransferase